MKASDTQSSQGPTMRTDALSFNSCSTDMKYGGLLKRTALKQFQKDLSAFISYVNTVSPSFTIVHTIVAIGRLLQIIGPSLCAPISRFWETNKQAEGTMQIISIIFHLIPPRNRPDSFLLLTIIYICVLLIVLCALAGSSYYFKKNASLPSSISTGISLYFATLGYLFHPILFQIMCEEISRYIFVQEIEKDLGTLIVLSIVALVLSILYFWIFLSIASRSLIFQPNSLMTVTSYPQNLIFISQIILTCLPAIVVYAPKPIYQIAALAINVIIYFASIPIMFFQGGIINHKMSSAYMASNFTGGLFTIIVIVGLIGNTYDASFLLFLLIVILWTISFIVINISLRKIKIQRLAQLDQILDENSSLEKMSTNAFTNLVVTGFSEAHPICISWELLKKGVDRFPSEQIAWYLYAKFVSMYPEETQTLEWIFRMIITNKIKGASAKTVKEQCLSISRQREAILSTDLKTKLNTTTKHISSAKHKLRHVWDLAIQGNIADMESATKRATREIEKSDAEMLHILRQFPNNRFVTRQYARFSREMKADYATYNDMVEKTRLLQRGMMVNKDQAHEYGILAFPNLPEKSNLHDNNISNTMGGDSTTASQFDLETEDEVNSENDDSLTLLNRIESLVIPSTRGTIIIRALIFLVIFAAPIIALIIYTTIFIDDISEPLEYMQYFTLTRTYVYQLAVFSTEMILEYFGTVPTPVHNSDEPPAYLGGSFDTRKQLAFIATQLAAVVQNVESFRTYSNTNPYILKSRDAIFGETTIFLYYDNLVPEERVITAQNAIADMILRQSLQVNVDTGIMADDIINQSYYLNIVKNLKNTALSFDEALNNIISFISDKDDAQQKLINIVMYSAFAVAVVLFMLSLIIELIWINRNKEQVYLCLTALPKNVVSTIAENLRVLKKDASENSSTNNNTETNKQEDNIMKILVTGGTGSSAKLIDGIVLIIGTVLIMILHIVCSFFLGSLLNEISTNLRVNSPHINYLQGAYANEIAAASTILLLLGRKNEKTDCVAMTNEEMIVLYDQRIKRAKDYYHLGRFGGDTVDKPPFTGYADGVKYAEAKVNCPDRYFIPTTFLEATRCYSADNLYVLVESSFQSEMVPFRSDPTYKLLEDPQGVLRDIWSVLVFPIYEAFFAPMSMTIVETITSDLDDMQKAQQPIVIALFVISFVIEVICFIQTLRIEKHMKDVLKLLLLCPSKAILSSVKIMSVLSGNFTSHRGDRGLRDNEFFKEVVMNLPDALIVANLENKEIEHINKSASRIIGMDTNTKETKTNINDLFSTFKNSDEAMSLVTSPTIGAAVSKVVQLIYVKKSDSSEINLEATSFIICNKLVIIMRDTTQQLRYNTLISEEKLKSDALLSSILPPMLVKRVQNGEKNISFAVQSATIVFMDIVSFTPWCGSLPAVKVMACLNNLFKKFDNCCAKQPTMTKIKCIGDCYMGAGGVFSEVNQPAEHAKEVVNFGLDALDSVGTFNAEMKENIEIRVGINTGGPIVAGVLGIGKPTFEILGPTINMAQQMEHHGVPMKVHVSRPVYELIYGDSFVIKERGQIEVKNGNVVTYLVSRKQ